MLESLFDRFRGGRDNRRSPSSDRPSGVPSDRERLVNSFRPREQSRDDVLREWTGGRDLSAPPAETITTTGPVAATGGSAEVTPAAKQPLPSDPFDVPPHDQDGTWSGQKAA